MNMIVDMRLRPPLPSWTKKPQFRKDVPYVPMRIGFPLAPSVEALSMDLLLEEMDQSGIKWGVIMGRQAAEPFGVIPNDEIAEAVRAYPDRFVGFIGLDASHGAEDGVAEITRCMKIGGFKGVSLEPSVSNSPMHAGDKRLYPIYEECERLGIPVSVTLGGGLVPAAGGKYEYNSPLPLYDVSKDFPKLSLIVSHGAWPWVRELLGIAFYRPNVIVSPDLHLNSPNLPGAEDYVKAANMYLGDRLLFGTAYPTRPLIQSVQAFQHWSFVEGVKEKVLGKNALRLMHMDA